MKKLLYLLISALFMFTSALVFSSCKTSEKSFSYDEYLATQTNSTSVRSDTENTTDLNSIKEQHKAANEVYNSLNTAQQLCTEVMDSIYKAGYFATYEATEYINPQARLEGFCSEVNLDTEETLNALETVLKSVGYSSPTDTQKIAALERYDLAIKTVIQIYTNNRTFTAINDNLIIAKSSFKAVTNDYRDYNTLESYYSKISEIVQFCKSPKSSFEQLQPIINEYNTSLKNHKSKLSFLSE